MPRNAEVTRRALAARTIDRAYVSTMQETTVRLTGFRAIIARLRRAIAAF